VGERGPAPTPTALKKLRGNPGRRPLPKNEPQPAMSAGAAPNWLAGGAAALLWKRVAPELVTLGLLSVLDVAALAMYCECHARERTLVKAAARLKIADPQRLGLLRAARDERQQMLSIGAKFGFTPADRSRVSTPEAQAPEKDPFEEWAKGRALRGGKAS